MKRKPASKSKPPPSGPAPAKNPLGLQPDGRIVVNFKPKSRLFIILSILFALWVGALLWLYFKTVYRSRHAPTPLTLPA